MKNFAVVVAATATTWGIGKNGGMPWKLNEDMKFFRQLTSTTTFSNKRNAVIMGRKTYESLPKKFRPLSSRLNIIISRNPLIRQTLELPDDVIVATSLEDALEGLDTAAMQALIDQIFIIGGESIYKESILLPGCSKIYLTSIEKPDYMDIDTYFPIVPASKYQLTFRSNLLEENGISFRFTEFESIIPPNKAFISPLSSSLATMIQCKNNTTKQQQHTDDEKNYSLPVAIYRPSWLPNHEEQQYLDLIERIITYGVRRGDRTGTGTLSQFGAQMRFSLRDGVFPLLTTKKVFWRGVAEELLWFIKGSTNAKLLEAKDIHIWDGNGSREFLDKTGLGHREEGDLGPVYGFQWRHFGAEYSDMHADYTGKGIDQLRECIRRIKTTPDDRRIILTAWNPVDLSLMALPPCHMFAQFYVANGELSCQMYQRSADIGLGVPFNIASYSLLTVMMAQVCGLKPGEFIHTIGDAHVYANHVEALHQQLTRTPRAFPKLVVNPAVTDIDEFQYSDFTIVDYQPDAAIKMTMAV